jgi:hypothetical protein
MAPDAFEGTRPTIGRAAPILSVLPLNGRVAQKRSRTRKPARRTRKQSADATQELPTRTHADGTGSALAFILVAYAFGTFLGAYTAATISQAHRRGVALTIALIMLGLITLNFAVIPHPMWMVVTGVLIPFPFALLGWKLALR